MNPPIPTEHQEQVRLFQLLALHSQRYPILSCIHATPNGGHRSKASSGKMKAEGQSAGYPDISIDVSRHGYHGARIELKRQDGGHGMSHQQLAWFDRLGQQGYLCTQCNGCDDAWAFICWYLEIKP